MGSLSKGMKFLVRIKYSLSMTFGLAASRFNTPLCSSFVCKVAVISTTWVFTGVFVSMETTADPRGRTATAADNLFHEGAQYRWPRPWSFLPGPPKRGYLFFAWRYNGDSARVKRTTSSPLRVLMSW
jgi:hypothetical protein